MLRNGWRRSAAIHPAIRNPASPALVFERAVLRKQCSAVHCLGGSIGSSSCQERPYDPSGFVGHCDTDQSRGLRYSRLRIQFAVRVCVSATRLRIAVAPTTRSLRKYPSPILVIRPNRSLPLDKFCRGTNPRKAANWRPDRKSVNWRGTLTLSASKLDPISHANLFGRTRRSRAVDGVTVARRWWGQMPRRTTKGN